MVGLTPKILHRLWLGPRSMPRVYADYGEKWRKLHPDWEYREWGLEDLPPLRNQALFDSCGVSWGGLAGAGKQASARQVQQADIAAYELVEQFGGVYVNCDLEPLKALDPLLDMVEGKAFAGQSPEPRYISNAVIGGPKRHWFWGAVIDFMPLRVATTPAKAMNFQTGPLLLTEVATREGQWPEPGNALKVFPFDFFSPYGYLDMGMEGGRFDTAYMEHHWGHRKSDEELWPGEPPQKMVPPDWLRYVMPHIRAISEKTNG